MSTNLTPKQKLFAILETTKPTVGIDCALTRVHEATKATSDSLTKAGMTLGFTAFECRGIMDGWDVTKGLSSTGLYRSWANEPGYAEGFEIGAEAAKRFA